MASEVLDYFREKEPRLADVDDGELTSYIGNRFPQFLQDDTFARQFKLREEQSNIPKDTTTAAQLPSVVFGSDPLLEAKEGARRGLAGLGEMGWRAVQLGANASAFNPMNPKPQSLGVALDAGGMAREARTIQDESRKRTEDTLLGQAAETAVGSLGPLALAPAGLPAVAAGAGFQQAAQRFGEESNSGAETGDAIKRSVVSGFITALATQLGGKTGVESVLKTGKSGIKALLKRMPIEALQEVKEEAVYDQAVQIIYDELAGNRSRTLGEIRDELLNTAGISALMGGAFASIPSQHPQPAESAPSIEQQPANATGEFDEAGAVELDTAKNASEDALLQAVNGAKTKAELDAITGDPRAKAIFESMAADVAAAVSKAVQDKVLAFESGAGGRTSGEHSGTGEPTVAPGEPTVAPETTGEGGSIPATVAGETATPVQQLVEQLQAATTPDQVTAILESEESTQSSQDPEVARQIEEAASQQMAGLTLDTPEAVRAVDTTRKAVRSAVGRKLADRIRVVYNPAWKRNGRTIEGATLPDGSIVLNAAAIPSRRRAREVAVHEGTHALLTSDDGRRIVLDTVAQWITPEERQAIIESGYGRRPGQTEQEHAQEVAEEWVSRASEMTPTRWRQFIDAIRAWLKRSLGMRLSREETARAMLRANRSARSTRGGPTRFSIAQDTGQTERERKLSRRMKEDENVSEDWKRSILNDTYRVMPHADTGAMAQAILDAIPDAEKAMEFFRHPPDGLPSAIRNAVGMGVVRRLAALETTARAAGDTAAAETLMLKSRDFVSDDILPASTDQGQAVDAWKFWSLMSPDGMMATASKVHDQAHNKWLEKWRPLTGVIKDTLDSAGDAAATETANSPEVQRAAQEAIDAAVEASQAPAGKREKARKAIRKARNTKPGSVGETEMERLIRKKIREYQINLGRALRAGRQRQVAKRIGDSIVDSSGLTGPEADKLREVFNRKFDQIATRRKAAELKKLFQAAKEGGAPRRILRGWERIIEAHNMGALTEETWNTLIRQKLGIKRIGTADLEKLRKIADELKGIPEDQINRRNELMSKFAGELAGLNAAWWELPMAVWYANVLSGPTTHAINVFSNVQNFTGRMLATAVHGPGAFLAGVEAVARSLPRAVREAVHAIVTGHAPSARMTKLEAPRALERLHGPLGLLATPWKLVARALISEDILFFVPARELKLALLTRKLAKSEGLRGLALLQEVRNRLFGSPGARAAAAKQAVSEGYKGRREILRRRDEILDARLREDQRQAAMDWALETTYNNKPWGWAGSVARATKWVRKEVPPAVFVAPFIDVVANVANTSLNYTPVGMGRAALAGFQTYFGKGGKLYGRDATPADVAELAAMSTVSTAILGALLAALMDQNDKDDPEFMISGLGPRDRGHRQTQRSIGWVPNSIKIGNRFYTYNGSPLFVPLNFIGNLMDSIRFQKMDEADVLDRFTYGISLLKNAFLNASFLDGVARLLEVKDTQSPKGGGQQFADAIGRIGSSFVVPNIAKQIDRLFDSMIYDHYGVKGALASQIPWARRKGKPLLNGLGEPVMSPLSNRFESKLSPDPVWRFLARINHNVSPSRQTTFNGLEMDDDTFYEFTKERGKFLRKILDEKLPALEKIDPDSARKIVNKYETLANNAARLRLALRIGLMR